MSDLRSNVERLQDPRQSKLELGGKHPDPGTEAHVDKRTSHSPAAKMATTKHRGDSDSVRPHLDARGGKGQRDAGAQDTASSSKSTSTKLPPSYK